MKTTNDIQKEALAAQQEGAWLEEQEAENNQNSELGKVLQYLAPWIEKTNGEESLEYYHPLDRAAMAYGLVVYVMTGTKMTFKSAVANQHYKTICKMLKEDMPQLMFAGHMKYMIRRYGKKKQ